MSYLPITIAAYLLNGFSLIIDKDLVDHSLKSPYIYTFYIGLLSLGVLILIPFGFQLPSGWAILIAVLSGLTFILALLTFFTVLKNLNLTVVSPLVGVTTPVVALLIETFLLGQRLSSQHLIAFFFLIAGSLLLTLKLWWGKHKLNKDLFLTILSGAFFGFSYILLKQAFEASSFVGGLVISRLAMFAFILIFLLFPNIRREVLASQISKHHFANRTGILVMGSQLAGAVSGLMLAYAISLSTPSLVNSIQGIQYVILLGAAYFLTKKDPQFLDEKVTSKNLSLKIFATFLMGFGLFLMAK